MTKVMLTIPVTEEAASLAGTGVVTAEEVAAGLLPEAEALPGVVEEATGDTMDEEVLAGEAMEEELAGETMVEEAPGTMVDEEAPGTMMVDDSAGIMEDLPEVGITLSEALSVAELMTALGL